MSTRCGNVRLLVVWTGRKLRSRSLTAWQWFGLCWLRYLFSLKLHRITCLFYSTDLRRKKKNLRWKEDYGRLLWGTSQLRREIFVSWLWCGFKKNRNMLSVPLRLQVLLEVTLPIIHISGSRYTLHNYTCRAWTYIPHNCHISWTLEAPAFTNWWLHFISCVYRLERNCAKSENIQRATVICVLRLPLCVAIISVATFISASNHIDLLMRGSANVCALCRVCSVHPYTAFCSSVFFFSGVIFS